MNTDVELVAGLAAVATHDIQGYIAARHEDSGKATSSNRRLSVIKRFYQMLLRQRRITADPSLKLVSAKQPHRFVHTLSDIQVEALLAAPEVTNTARPASLLCSSGSMQRIRCQFAVTFTAITSSQAFGSTCDSGDSGPRLRRALRRGPAKVVARLRLNRPLSLFPVVHVVMRVCVAGLTKAALGAATPPKARGFGTRMIERGLAAELGGTAKIDFRPEGLVCTVDAPLPEGAE